MSYLPRLRTRWLLLLAAIVVTAAMAVIHDGGLGILSLFYMLPFGLKAYFHRSDGQEIFFPFYAWYAFLLSAIFWARGRWFTLFYALLLVTFLVSLKGCFVPVH